MPPTFKNCAFQTDAGTMSEIVTDESTPLTAAAPQPSRSIDRVEGVGTAAQSTAPLLDGEAPRLATGPLLAPAPAGPVAPMADPSGTLAIGGDAPALPLVSPVLTTDTPAAPTLPSAESLPTAFDTTTDGATSEPSTSDAEPTHAMAHLMPKKSMPTEASRRAAEIRAAQKAKGKKIKIGIIAGMLVFTAAVGPPLGKWLVNAINEAGNTSSVEEPAE